MNTDNEKYTNKMTLIKVHTDGHQEWKVYKQTDTDKSIQTNGHW